MSTGPLLAFRLDRGHPLGLQVEQQVRELIRTRALRVGESLPSTRSLAADLEVSRGVVVGAYAQLAAEGYITLGRGAPPVVAASGRAAERVPELPVARFARATCLPDFGLFPRTDWLATMRASLRRAAGQDFAYGEPLGAAHLRRELVPFLARTRGVVGEPDRTCIFAGSSQALFVLGSILRARGVRQIGVEDPGHRWRTKTIAASGLEVVPVPVDDAGLRVDRIPDVPAVVVSPGHHFPLGVALSPERRRALVEWAAEGDRLVVEHEYDAHFRYDRLSVAALQSLAPEHVAYVGSASALLAPTVRIGWAVLPARLVAPVVDRLFETSLSTSRLTQLALAEFIARGYLDRHLRKSGAVYQRRRAALVAALARHVPDVRVTGGAAGLFLSLALPDSADEAAVLAESRARGVMLDGFDEHALAGHAPGLAFGFSGGPEAALRIRTPVFAEALAAAA